MSARLLGLALGATTLIVISCRSLAGRPTEELDASARDTVRGVLSVVGAAPLTALVLAPSNGGRTVAVEGSQQALMRGLSRMEVVATGRMTSRRSSASPSLEVFEADSFVVRAADRVPAHDGVVEREGDRFFLVCGASREEVAHLPAALKRALGARVFLVGPLDQAPIAYGIIVSAP